MLRWVSTSTDDSDGTMRTVHRLEVSLRNGQPLAELLPDGSTIIVLVCNEAESQPLRSEYAVNVRRGETDKVAPERAQKIAAAVARACIAAKGG